MRKGRGNQRGSGGGGRVWRHAESRPQRPQGGQGAGRAGVGAWERRGRPRGPTGRSLEEEPAAEGALQTDRPDSAVTHKVESTTNSTGGCSVSYFMDGYCGLQGTTPPPPPHPPPSGPRATGEPRGRAPRAPPAPPERPPLPPWPAPETRPGLLGCPEGGRWTSEPNAAGEAAKPSAQGRMPDVQKAGKGRRRHGGGSGARDPTLIKWTPLLSLIRDSLAGYSGGMGLAGTWMLRMVGGKSLSPGRKWFGSA